MDEQFLKLLLLVLAIDFAGLFILGFLVIRGRAAFRDPKSESYDWLEHYIIIPAQAGIAVPFILIPILSYPMAIVRWFLTDHYAFWEGFKELVWVLIPIANIFYVWDWWVTLLVFLFWSVPILIRGLVM